MLCPICEQKFSKDREPRMLQCGHYFCFPCVKELHSSNSGRIPCYQCKGREYYADITKLPVNLYVEARMASLSLKEEDVATGASVEEKESLWDRCSIHGEPLSLWCITCDHAVCPNCREFHQGQQHKVVDYMQARELLLSHYNHESQVFHDWLNKVEVATQEMIKTSQGSVAPLEQTLSIVQRHISEIKGQNQALETTTSLETVEDLLEKRSRWCKRNQTAVYQQMQGCVSALEKFDSPMKNLRRLQKEMNSSFAESGATAPANVPRVSALPDMASLSSNQTAYLDLPSDLGEHCTTHLKVLATKVERTASKGFWLTYIDTSSRQLFITTCDFNNDRLDIRTWDPTTRKLQKKEPLRRQFGLRWGVFHRLTILHDPSKYTILLDGIAVDYVSKAGLSQVARIKVGSWLGAQEPTMGVCTGWSCMMNIGKNRLAATHLQTPSTSSPLPGSAAPVDWHSISRLSLGYFSLSALTMLLFFLVRRAYNGQLLPSSSSYQLVTEASSH